MSTKVKIALASVAVFLLAPLFAGASNSASGAMASLSYLGKAGFPRGMRNNNPGNIRKGASAWQGKIQNGTDSAFEQFISYGYGIRAMIKNLLSYQRDGLNTISKMIYRWAPPADSNDTEGYIAFVSAKTGISRNTPIDLTDKNTCSKIVRAMCQMENYGGASGKPQAVTPEQFNYAWSLTFQ